MNHYVSRGKNPNLRSKHPDVPHVNQNLKFFVQFMQVYALFNDFFSENYNVPCKYRSFSYVEILAN